MRRQFYSISRAKTRSVPCGALQCQAMSAVKTPCIGICSTTSLGDRICRGCKRFGFEVIHWNQYSEEAKRAVLNRIDQLTSQIMAERFRIFAVQKLRQALEDYRFFYDPGMSPYCWLHNLLQKRLYSITSLDEIGVELTPDYRDIDLRDLILEINQELYVLSEAHFDRYFANVMQR